MFRFLSRLILAAAVLGLGCSSKDDDNKVNSNVCKGDYVVTSAEGIKQIADCKVIDGKLVISLKDDLTNVSGLSGLTEVTGLLSIKDNDKLTEVSGLSSLTEVGGLSIENNSALTEVDGLSHLTEVDGLNIENNDALTDVSGLSSLTEVTGLLSIKDNDKLTEVDGLTGLTEVGGLSIEDNDALTEVDGLSGLKRVTGDILIARNRLLASLQGLLNIEAITGDHVTVKDNESLPQSEKDAFLDHAQKVKTVASVNECTGKADFTLCTLVTSPDRSYDICSGGECVSPGCGDATCNAPGPHFTLADTNQRKCYDDSAEITCPATGEDFYGQDAQYGWDTTNLPEMRFTRDTATTDQPVVTDNVTGLIWQGCPAGLTGDDCATGTASKTDWADSLVYCDDLDWGGHTDWRLPDRYELASIVDDGRSGDPVIDPTAFPATPSDWFWSSSSNADVASYAWSVGFVYGGVDSGLDKDGTNSARCVCSSP